MLFLCVFGSPFKKEGQSNIVSTSIFPNTDIHTPCTEIHVFQSASLCVLASLGNNNNNEKIMY